MNEPASMRYSSETVRQQILAILRAWGMAPLRAGTTAEVMTETDLAGIDSHGISMLPGYQRLLEQDKIAIEADPIVVSESASTAVIDGANNLGHATMVEAMKLAVSKAEASGVSAVTVRRSLHFGAAGYYARLAAEEGLLGLVMSTTRTKAVVPTRGSRPLLGTNPLAFAAPSAKADEPFLLDMSTSTVAVNKVKVYDYLQRPLPSGWVLDELGSPVTDPGAAYTRLRAAEDGGLTPLGGGEATASHKGYGLAVMVQILAGALSGASFAPLKDAGGPDDIGHFCLAIHPGFFGDPGQLAASVSAIIGRLREEPPLAPDRPVLVAGDLERRMRAERLEMGIPLSAALIGQLHEVCSKSGSAFLL